MTPPDSGEREVMGHKPWCQSLYADPVSGKPYPCNCVEMPPDPGEVVEVAPKMPSRVKKPEAA